MKNVKKTFVRLEVILIFFVAVSQLSAQRKEDIGKEPVDAPRQTGSSSIERSATVFSRTANLSTGIPRNTSPEELARRREEMENWNETKQMLRPPNSYYERFGDLLIDDDIRLARIFVDKNCDAGKTVTVEELERCDGVPPVKGGGSFYSFRLNTNYVYGNNWWDIHLADNQFKVGNDTVQTIIADIGKISLLDVNLKTKAFEFLKKYKPVQTLAEIRENNKALKKGIESNNFTYSNSVAVNFDSTYVLRTVAYRLSNEPQWGGTGTGLDSFLAFKIVGREADGSLVILWKHLKTELPRRELK